MSASRRKQLHPKSLKEDALLFMLPDELKCDEDSNTIITRTNLEQGHRFGPFPATLLIQDRRECFQLLDIKHNWLTYCLNLNKTLRNLDLIFQDNQLFAIVKQSIPINTNLYLNKIILPKLNMNKDIHIKQEPREIKNHYPLIFICNTCGIRFSNQDTLNAHRQHYCIKHETTKSHSTDSSMSIKRKSIDITDSSSIPKKRLLNENYYKDNHNSSSCKSISLNHPIQIGNFIYVPIPFIPSQIDNQDNKPLDLSKPKKINNEYDKSINSPLDLSIEKRKKIIHDKLYQCDCCSIHFRSLKTLLAHQENYCNQFRKQTKKDMNQSTDTIDDRRSQSPTSTYKSLQTDSIKSIHHSPLYICRLCKYRGNTLRGMRMHFKFHLSNNEPCSDADIIIKSTIKQNLSPTEFLLKCTICSAMFDYEQTLLNHIKCVHTNESLLECLECQSRFCSKWNLIRHMKYSHTNIKSDEDEQDKLSDPVNLIDIKKKYSCQFCHIKFANIDTLKQHMINYCSSRPSMDKTDTYCTLCNISFQHKTSYIAHKVYYCRDNIKLKS